MGNARESVSITPVGSTGDGGGLPSPKALSTTAPNATLAISFLSMTRHFPRVLALGDLHGLYRSVFHESVTPELNANA